ncbi:MAG: tetratricopeptide repeat protein [Candidatus Omnitrophota bacterium]
MKKVFFILILCFCQVHLCFGLDWKALHEEADKKSLSDSPESVRQGQDSVGDLYVLGLVYLNAHKDKEAGESFSRILSLDPDSIEAKWGVAEVLRRTHELDESENLLNEALKADPNFSPALISLAYTRYIQMKFDEAVKLARKVQGQGMDKVDLSNYVRALLLIGGAKGMIAHYGGPLSKVINGTAIMPNLKKAEKLQPDSAGVAFGLGSFYFLAPGIVGGSRQKAQEYLKRAIELDPYFVDAYVRIAQLYSVQGDSDKFKEYLRRAQEIDPENEILLDFMSGTCKFICAGGEEE